MRAGFRKFADGFRIVVFTSDSAVRFPEYMTVKQEHNLERDDVKQFEALVPHDKGLAFWRWCQAAPDVAIKLDVQSEFHCPSCLTRRSQAPWSPARNTHKNWHEIVVRCGKCEAFYRVIYTMTDLKKRRKRR